MLDDVHLKKVAVYQDSLNTLSLLAHPVSIINFKSFLEKRRPAFSRFNRINFDEVFANSEQVESPFFSFASPSKDRLAININIKELETKQLENLLSQLRNTFAQVFDPAQYDLKIHGFPAVYAQLNQFILQTQFRSFGAAFLVAFLILFYFIGISHQRSFKIGRTTRYFCDQMGNIASTATFSSRQGLIPFDQLFSYPFFQ